MPTTFLEKVYMQGGAVISGDGSSFPASSVGDAAFNASDPLTAVKQQHQYVARQAQVHGSAATAERRVAHVARAAGTLVEVKLSVVVAAIGDSTVTVDVRKNGTTMLTGTVGLASANAAYSTVAGSISGSGAYVAGDVIEIVQTVSAGTGTLPQGVCTELVLREAA